jgi:hypothetical protein
MSEVQEDVGGSDYRLGEVRCADCGERAALFAAGWRAYAGADAYTDELPALAFRCPDCALAEPGSA